MADQKLFSKHIYSVEFQEEFKKHWHSQSNFKSANLEIISKPFKVCRISNFLRDKTFIENLKNEIEHFDHTRKDLDLYQFEKTSDLVSATTEYIPILNRSFREDLVSWMKFNTNIELNGKVSMSSARYYKRDYLLCHDDNMDDRRIAYIFYLTNDWSKEDGGALDLFDTDEEGLPRNVVKSLIPEYNSLVFFEVADNSYHQVAEVLTEDKCRWSINGWFHGPLKKDFHKPRKCKPEKTFVEPNCTEVNLHSWITDEYLNPDITAQIQVEVQIQSYTLLKDFLKEPMYQQIANDLTSRDISWRMIGPPNVRHYEVADEQTLPKLLKDFCELFKSISFFQLLNEYTGLDLVPEENNRPKMTLELQRWSAGCYTLLYDESLLMDTSNESIKTDQFDKDISVDDVAAPIHASTSDISTNLSNETCRELKRKWIDAPHLPKSIPISKKVPRLASKSEDLLTRIIVDKQLACSNEHEHDIDLETDTSSSSSSTIRSVSSYSNESPSDFLLEVMIQFHVQDAKGMQKTKDSIDFVDPSDEEGILVQVPTYDNHLCLVYRSLAICRLQKYLNHLYDGYSYTFICTYHE